MSRHAPSRSKVQHIKARFCFLLPSPGNIRYRYDLADGRTLAVAFSDKGAGGIAIFDAQSGGRLKVLRGHASFVSALAFSPDGKLLASSSGDGTVILWDMAH